MHRLTRHLISLCAAVSLLICAAFCVIWARSYRLSEQINWQNAHGWRTIRSARGNLEVAFLRIDWSAYPKDFHGPRYRRDQAQGPVNYLLFMGGSTGDVDSSWEWHHFEWHQKRNRAQGSLHAQGAVPFWFLALTTAILPLTWITRRLRSRILKKQSGLCPTCGYDLRATPHRCPECGTEFRRSNVPKPLPPAP